jgi:hypothetical protein
MVLGVQSVKAASMIKVMLPVMELATESGVEKKSPAEVMLYPLASMDTGM